MLGTHLHLDTVVDTLVPTIVFSLFVLFGNPFIVMLIMRMLGYHQRTGFLCGGAAAQISEFSFIVLVAGVAAGHLPQDVVGMAAAVGVITIAGSSFVIENNERIYQRIRHLFEWLEPRTVLESELLMEHKPMEVVLMGYHRTGAELLPTIRSMKRSYVVVDFDPEAIRELAEIEEPSVYGDVGDEAFLEEMVVEDYEMFPLILAIEGTDTTSPLTSIMAEGYASLYVYDSGAVEGSGVIYYDQTGECDMARMGLAGEICEVSTLTDGEFSLTGEVTDDRGVP